MKKLFKYGFRFFAMLLVIAIGGWLRADGTKANLILIMIGCLVLLSSFFIVQDWKVKS
jgi:hypothetical protein